MQVTLSDNRGVASLSGSDHGFCTVVPVGGSVAVMAGVVDGGGVAVVGAAAVDPGVRTEVDVVDEVDCDGLLVGLDVVELDVVALVEVVGSLEGFDEPVQAEVRPAIARTATTPTSRRRTSRKWMSRACAHDVMGPPGGWPRSGDIPA